jgi:hypothetical protein
MSNIPSVPKPNPNARLLQFRKLHTWIGLFASVFLILIASTGIYLNHKDTFRPVLEFVGAPRKDAAKDYEKKKAPSPHEPPGQRILSADELATLPISFAGALETAAMRLNDRPIERVELKPEHGRIVYKIRSVDGPEVIVDAHTGHWELKGERKDSKAGRENHEKHAKGEKDERFMNNSARGQPDSHGASPESGPTDSPKPKPMDWGKAIKDLHTGKIGGDAGKLFVDLVAVGLIFLTVTGLYLWIIPALRKHRSAKQRAAAEAAKAVVPNNGPP